MHYLNKQPPFCLPEILVIDIFGLNNHLCQIECDIGIRLTDDNTLNDITDCIKVESKAITELEYYCLGLVGNHCTNGPIDKYTNMYLKYLIDFGNSILKNLKGLGVYHNGVLPYSYRSRQHDALCLMRRDAMYNQIKKELTNDGLYRSTYPTVRSSTQYQRIIR